MTLTLNDLRVDCIIGDRPSERTAPQTLEPPPGPWAEA